MHRLFKPVWVLRTKSHVNTRLQLLEERTYHYRLLPWLAMVNLAFSGVDAVTTSSGRGLGFFFCLRLAGILLSWLVYRLLRGRVRYGLRFFCILSPYVFPVEYIMLSEGLSLTPYFAGFALVLITSTMLFPVKTRVAGVVYGVTALPVIAHTLIHSPASTVDAFNVILMCFGTVLVCAVNSGQVYQDLKKRLIVSETLARDLGKREKEIRKKASELLRRKAFEAHFSPQVVSAVLKDPRSLSRMQSRDVVVLVIDIESSTSKAKELPPEIYKGVVEEVFDVFSSACLKWNVTVDKFTGDGAQAFAGAPVSSGDDLNRALQACKESIRMLEARRVELDRKWRSPLAVRFAAVEGSALVGFIGRGALKSFTALGETVSFAHRLCGAGRPWHVHFYSLKWPDISGLCSLLGLNSEPGSAIGLKGFENVTYKTWHLSPISDEQEYLDFGRCELCDTPLVLEEVGAGIPKILCPGCESRTEAAA